MLAAYKINALTVLSVLLSHSIYGLPAASGNNFYRADNVKYFCPDLQTGTAYSIVSPTPSTPRYFIDYWLGTAQTLPGNS